jgi:hypothetical protein
VKKSVGLDRSQFKILEVEVKIVNSLNRIIISEIITVFSEKIRGKI